MNINKIVKSVKDKYDNTTINPLQNIKVELVINYKESLKTLDDINEEDLKKCSEFFKLVRKQVLKELE
tara:strand:- start:761 stop:964 length:204 start_codon:yes stop_codon:yes gene_type:complete